MRAGRDPGQRSRIARVDLDCAHGIRLAGVLRALVAIRPGGPDPADEIEPRVEAIGQFDRNLTSADSKGVVGHVGSPADAGLANRPGASNGMSGFTPPP